MIFKTLIGTLAIVGTLIAPTSFVFADEIAQTPTTESVVVTSETTPVTPLEELALLKAREQDPETGTFMKFILRLKIRQLENQLNIKKALK